MNHNSHRNIAKLLFPKVPFKVIDNVNSILDAPTRRAKALNSAYNSLYLPDGKGGIEQKYFNPFDFYGLGKNSPHRRTNHDVVSAAIMSGMEHGPLGVMLAMLHLNLDNTSDQWKKMYGRSYRDVMESYLNFGLERRRKVTRPSF